MKSNNHCLLLILVAGLVFVGCGVRGRPQPPLTPPELGRGQPTFKRGTEEFAFPAVPTPAPQSDRRPIHSESEGN